MIDGLGASVDTTRSLVRTMGGRFSLEMGIHVDMGSDEVDRWFLAATLFGTRISWEIVERTFRILHAAGVGTVGDAEARTWEELVELLDAGGYARYDERTATRLQRLGKIVRDRYGGTVSELGSELDPRTLEAALDALPGWGPVTVRLFLRELRGTWPGARPPIDDRALASAQHLGLPIGPPNALRRLAAMAERARVEPRDLEAALVRLSLEHGRAFDRCPGRARCVAVMAEAA